jgi:hypothetical protein
MMIALDSEDMTYGVDASAEMEAAKRFQSFQVSKLSGTTLNRHYSSCNRQQELPARHPKGL